MILHSYLRTRHVRCAAPPLGCGAYYDEVSAPVVIELAGDTWRGVTPCCGEANTEWIAEPGADKALLAAGWMRSRDGRWRKSEGIEPSLPAAPRARWEQMEMRLEGCA